MKYRVTHKMEDAMVRHYQDMECMCQPDLPDGRTFEMCMPCKVRQDLMDETTNQEIPFEFNMENKMNNQQQFNTVNPTDLRLYEALITIQDGERQYSRKERILAPSAEVALRIAREDLAELHQDCVEEACGLYWNSCGETLTQVSHVSEVQYLTAMDAEGTTYLIKLGTPEVMAPAKLMVTDWID